MGFSEKENELLDRILRTRRSVRQFKDDTPPAELLEKVIEAGRIAPFASVPNLGTDDFRRFFVIARGSKIIGRIKSLLIEKIKEKILVVEHENDPRKAAMLKVMKKMVENGPPLENAPWFIIVAERRGFPVREQQSLAHCLQNMWLKATGLSLGFQLISAIEQLNDSPELSSMLGLATGEFRFDSCLIGYPANTPSDVARNVPKLSITWFQ